MTVVIGTSSGFVTTAPTSDPAGYAASNLTAFGGNDTTTSLYAIKVTEMGFWCDNAISRNFTVSIYSSDKSTRLYISGSGATTGSVGWQKITGLNFSLDASTQYWLRIDASGTVNTNYNSSTSGKDFYYTAWTGVYGGDNCGAVYALYEEAAAGTNLQINIGDTWKEISAAKINIGDTWKEVAGMQVNIGDTWKTVF